jgi:hypothetical protein
MALKPEVLDALLAAGATAEMIVAAVKADTAQDEQRRADKRANGAERQRRRRERNAESRDVTPVTRDERDTPSFPSEVSPTPPSYPTNLTPEPPIVPRSKGISSAEKRLLVEKLWAFQPITKGKRKSGRSDVATALDSALKRGGDPAEIEASFAAYYALPACREEDGQFSKGAAVLLNADRWRDFLPSAENAAAAINFAGPADVIQAVVGATDPQRAATLLGRCAWQDVPERALVSSNNVVVNQLREGDVWQALRGIGVDVRLEKAA